MSTSYNSTYSYFAKSYGLCRSMSLFSSVRQLVSLLNVDQHVGGLVSLFGGDFDPLGMPFVCAASL